MENKIALQKKSIAIDVIRAVAALDVFYYHNHLGATLAKYSGMQFLNVTDTVLDITN